MHFRFHFVTRRYKAADSCVILRRPATDEDALLGIVPIIRRIVETIIPDDEERSRLYGKSAHIRKSRCKSVLYMPIRSKGEFKGILYLGNNLAVGVINQRREEHLAPIAAQLTISLENVYLYEHYCAPRRDQGAPGRRREACLPGELRRVDRVPNRRLLQQMLSRSLHKAETGSKTLAALYMDPDGPKR